MSHPLVAIIVLTWNQEEDTLECLGSVAKVKYDHYFTVLVDNGSIDGTVQSVTSRFPNVQVIETGENLGYVGGNNVGITYAIDHGADYVFLLNNDTTVAPGFLTPLVAYAEANQCAGILGPKVYMYNQPKTIWFAGATFDSQGILRHDGFGQSDKGQFDRIQESVYIPGCSVLVKKAVISNVGLLDPRFFYLFEEVDWCFRARRAGYSSVLIPSSHIWHKEAAAYGGKNTPTYLYYFTRNHLLLIRRNFNVWERHRLYYHDLRKCCERWRAFKFGGQPEGRVQAQAILAALLDFWRGAFGKCSHGFAEG